MPRRADPHGFVAAIRYRVRHVQRAWIASFAVSIMTPAPVCLGPITVAFAMRTGLSHPSITLPWQPVIDFALPS
jgi:hypothetical protein